MISAMKRMKRIETHLDLLDPHLARLFHLIHLKWIIFQCLPLWPTNHLMGGACTA